MRAAIYMDVLQTQRWMNLVFYDSKPKGASILKALVLPVGCKNTEVQDDSNVYLDFYDLSSFWTFDFLVHSKFVLEIPYKPPGGVRLFPEKKTTICNKKTK